MEIILLSIILVLVVVGVGAVVYALFLRDTSGKGDAFSMLQQQLGELNRTMDTKLRETHEASKNQFTESSKIIKDVTERLTRLDETNKQVLSVNEQLQRLQDILKNPKHRGTLGEYQLETILSNALPPGSYEMQYRFSDGSTVDAIVRYDEKIIPIDSKFSLENYNRVLDAKDETEREQRIKDLRNDLKKRIDETAKYIKPSENTVEFALMFIPAEAVFYDLITNKVGAIVERTLLDYALVEKKVIPVSPTSFLAYLQTVLQGLRQMEFNRSAEEIRKNVYKLHRHLKSYETFMEKVGKHLDTTQNMYQSALKEFEKIDKDILKIAGTLEEVEE